MKKLIGLIGVIALVAGAVLFGTNFNKARAAAKEEVKTVTTDVNDEFQNINIDIDTSDLIIKKSDNGLTRVECAETEKIFHEVKVEDGTLKVIQNDTRKWTESMFNFFYNELKVTIYLGETDFNNLNILVSTGYIDVAKELTFKTAEIKGSTGDVSVRAKVLDSININLSTGRITVEETNTKNLFVKASTGIVNLKNITVEEKTTINVSTGDIYLSDLTSGKINISSSTGDLFLTNVIANDDIIIKTSTGNVIFDHSDAQSLNIETSTGDVRGSFLTPKTFIISADIKHVDVPKTNGGFCDIKTDTGRIKITIVE